MITKIKENGANCLEENSSNENDQSSPKKENDVIVLEMSQSDERNKNLSPRGGRYTLRPNPNPN